MEKARWANRAYPHAPCGLGALRVNWGQVQVTTLAQEGASEDLMLVARQGMFLKTGKMCLRTGDKIQSGSKVSDVDDINHTSVACLLQARVRASGRPRIPCLAEAPEGDGEQEGALREVTGACTSLSSP